MSILSLALLLVAAPLQIAWGFDAQEEARRFAMFDTDGDGRISQDEYQLNKVQAFLLSRPGQLDRVVQLKLEDTQLTKEAFELLDINGDGTLSGGEIISAPVLQFSAIDTNGDGFIDRAEFHALVLKLMK